MIRAVQGSHPCRRAGRIPLWVAILLAIIVVVAGAGIYYWQRNRAIELEAKERGYLQDLQQPKNMALAALASHDEVRAALGEPIEQEGEHRREGTGELDRSNALFSFDVKGDKGKAAVLATAEQKDGAWRLKKIEVKLPDGKSVDVPPPTADAPPEVNLDF
jgi:hypothetical protein